jgi:hypothetical protein
MVMTGHRMVRTSGTVSDVYAAAFLLAYCCTVAAVVLQALVRHVMKGDNRELA